MTLPLTPEQEAWMKRVAPPTKQSLRDVKQEKTIAAPVFTDPQIEWLWPRFQACRFGSGASFAKSFAKTDLERLTSKGKACLHTVAYHYRRQIFKDSAKWSLETFIEAVRRAV